MGTFYLKSVLDTEKMLNIEDWNQVGEPQEITKAGKFHGRSFCVYTKQIHHDNADWLIKRGLAAFFATLFSLGLALLSKDVRSLWRQSLTGDETKRIKVIDDTNQNDVTKKVFDINSKWMIDYKTFCKETIDSALTKFTNKLKETVEKCQEPIKEGIKFTGYTINISIGEKDWEFTYALNTEGNNSALIEQFTKNLMNCSKLVEEITKTLTLGVNELRKTYLERKQKTITKDDYKFKMACTFFGDNSPSASRLKTIVTGSFDQDCRMEKSRCYIEQEE